MLNEMSHTKSIALEQLVIQILGGLNRFYGIPSLALGLGMVHQGPYIARTAHSMEIAHEILTMYYASFTCPLSRSSRYCRHFGIKSWSFLLNNYKDWLHSNK